MNQKLSDWASIADIASGIAVVITLVFLIVGIQDNTEAVRAQNRQAISEGARQVQLAVATNPSLAEALTGGRIQANEPTELQLQQVGAWVGALLTSAQEAYLQYESGVLDEDLWFFRKRQLVGQLRRNIQIRRTYDLTKGIFVEGFVSEIDAALIESNVE